MGECRRLFEFNDNPGIVKLKDRDLLGFFHGDTVVLTDFEGHKTPMADVRFSDVLVDVGEQIRKIATFVALPISF